MSFRIELKPSGNAFQVEPGEPILRSGLDAGFSMPYSCQTGVCKTCRGRILEGQVDYGMVHPTYLTDTDKAGGYALLCQASPLSDLVIEVREVGGLENIRPQIVPCRVLKIQRPAPDVAVLTLKLPMNENMLFVAGQYIDLLLKDGKRRSYSIATAPSSDGVTMIELHVRHMPGGLFTDQLFSIMKERDLLRFEGPLGTFHLRAPSGKPAVLVASGTGFAPIKAICEAVFRRGLSAEQPLTLYWGCRRRIDLYSLETAERWAVEHPGFRFIPVLSEPSEACGWSGRTGLVHQAVMADHPDMRDVEIYACGAPVMVEAARRDFIARCGLPVDSFFADSFLSEADRAGAVATV
jgi:CDP-4-dehydro-6-deoxyglucose reductase